MKAAIYCRLSKEDEHPDKEGIPRESESIQNQRAMLQDYARDQGYEVYRVYCDEDYSGVDRSRPAFNAMLEDARQRKFQVLLVKTQSRFTRDMELVEKYLHGKFVEWGIRFIAVVDHADTADPGNKKSRQIAGLVNEWYLEDLSENVRSVLGHKRREGQYIAPFALYGYRKDPQDPHHLLVDPEAAAVVRRIFALYCQGNGATRIARLLDEEGVPSPTAYRRGQGASLAEPWSRATIYQMLGNGTYAGNLEQGRHRKVSYKSKKVVSLPREQWIVVPHTHEAIIDPPVFAQVQRMLRLKARGRPGGNVHPLAGLVVCGLCGSRMERTGAGGGYYRCSLSARDKARCPGQKYLPADVLLALVGERVRSHTHGLLPKTPPPQKGARELLDREIAWRRRALRQLYRDNREGVLPQASFQELQRLFRQEIQALESRANRLQTGTRTGAVSPAEEAMPDRALACLLIHRIVIWPPGEGGRTVEIRWRF